MLLLKIAHGMRDGDRWEDYPEPARLFVTLNDRQLYAAKGAVDGSYTRTITEKGKQWLEDYQRKNAPCS